MTNTATNSAVISAADNFIQNGINAPAIETATASAGIGILPANSSEIIIYNNSVKDNSLVYLTLTSPISPISPISLTVSKKESCSITSLTNNCRPYFEVTVDKPQVVDINFNWLIVH